MTNENILDAQPVIAIAVLILVGIVVGIVAWRGTNELLNTTVSFVMGGGLSGVVGYYFGSAKGSQAKDQTIAQLATQQQPKPQTLPLSESEKEKETIQ